MDSSKDFIQVRKSSSSCNNIAAILLGFFFIVSLFVFISNPVGSNKPFFSLQQYHHNCSSQQSNTSNRQKGSLDAALAEASTGNKSLIITIVNKAYVEGDKPMLDLFLDSFWFGDDTRHLVNHLLLVTMDQTSYNRCIFLRLHCYKLKTNGVDFDREKIYMSDDFIRMMWRRTLFLGDVLKRGYSFIFTDTDVMWLRNPFPRLIQNENIDIQISTDKFNGNEWSERNRINTGFYMIRSNNKTISLFESWYAKKDSSVGLKEQDVLQNMLEEGIFRQLGVGVRFLDTKYFSGFCQQSKDIREVSTVHANCCRTISAKIADLMDVIHTWNNLKMNMNNHTSAFANFKHLNCNNSWKSI
ncbi:Nucleotide-diphospho-sugar transferase family protein [Euphorbia peplus]|nr:Nucleotide-diphospho-sugar transferase family protein [Euphorbia peplus]